MDEVTKETVVSIVRKLMYMVVTDSRNERLQAANQAVDELLQLQERNTDGTQGQRSQTG